MIIAVAGPYSAPTASGRKKNLERMNKAAAKLLKMGHVPVIGMNAALPVVTELKGEKKYEAIMKISLAVVSTCDAILLLAPSPGANREKDLLVKQGKSVYLKIADVPDSEG
jgi:hypothetical protein